MNGHPSLFSDLSATSWAIGFLVISILICLIQVTVNSGGVVFFALFNTSDNDDLLPKEAAAVIKFASSRMATQSERLGYEFANCLGVRTPQVRAVSIYYSHSVASVNCRLYLDHCYNGCRLE